MSSGLKTPGPLLLTGAVQHYGWGGFEFIPHLLGVSNPDGKPFAELWFGAHSSAPSTVQFEGRAMGLDALIASNPPRMLGEAVARRFGNRLPFLLKVLDARQMLSIQAHPSKQQAEEGFAQENAAGIPLEAPHRTYRDDNHKPEVHVALTEFWMLHGFRPLAEVDDVLRAVPEFAPLARFLLQQGAEGKSDQRVMRELYRHVMTLPQLEIDHLLEPLIQRLERETPLDRDHPDYWALRAARSFLTPECHRDRGIVSMYLLNLVHLHPGEGTYQPAGVLHAYLEGTNIELMANSDNVLRGGLTRKHVDVPELLRILDFRCGRPDALHGSARPPHETVYQTAAGDFELSHVTLPPHQAWRRPTECAAEIWLPLTGSGQIECLDVPTTEFTEGRARFLPPGCGCTIRAGTDGLDLFRATLPTPL